MGLLHWLIYGSGALHLLIALAGVLAPRVLHYDDAMRGVTPIVREVFFIHNWYMTLFVLALAGLCVFFNDQMAGGSPIGRYLGGFLGFIWFLRALIQFVYHNREIKRAHPVMNVVFTATFLYLGAVHSAAALGLGR